MRSHAPRPGWVASAASRVVFIALMGLLTSACASGSRLATTDETTATSSVASRTPHGLCLDGASRYRRITVKVDRAVVAPLASVKKWVLSTSPEIEWRTFSDTLASAPLDERVAVCVLSKNDTSYFEPPGLGHKLKSVVVIVRPNGEGTFFFGDHLATTWTALRRGFDHGAGVRHPRIHEKAVMGFRTQGSPRVRMTIPHFDVPCAYRVFPTQRRSSSARTGQKNSGRGSRMLPAPAPSSHPG